MTGSLTRCIACALMLLATGCPADAEKWNGSEVFSGSFDKRGQLVKVMKKAAAWDRTLYLVNVDGGLINEAIEARRIANELNVQLRFYGYCASACTILLSANRACAEEGIRLEFHAAYNARTGKVSKEVTEMIRTQYHLPSIREAFDKSGAYKVEPPWIMLNGPRIPIEKDGVLLCGW